MVNEISNGLSNGKRSEAAESGGMRVTQKQITAPSSNKATGGTTSSSYMMGKTMGEGKGNGKGHDSAGWWMSYGGQGQLMDVDR